MSSLGVCLVYVIHDYYGILTGYADDETDMKALEAAVRGIEKDGLVWGASKLVPVGFGIKKLQINLVIEDDKIGLDDLQEEIAEFEDYVQSSDIVSPCFRNVKRASLTTCLLGCYAKTIEHFCLLGHFFLHAFSGISLTFQRLLGLWLFVRWEDKIAS